MFKDELIEEIMEEVKIEVKHFNYFEGYAETRWEPSEPEEIEIHYIAEYEGIDSVMTAQQLQNIQELKENKHFMSYLELYMQHIIEDKLYSEELDYWETIANKDDIEIKIEANTLIIDVYHRD